uniref:Uncharacterized protein n=1 Tax=Ascaris lumbricoides TaxID=6252 RepID=A0A0M3HIG2_ASCLU
MGRGDVVSMFTDVAPLKKIRPYSESLERLLNEKISDCNYFDAPKLRNQAREIYVGSNTSQEGIVRSLMRVRFTLITVLYLLIRTLSNDVFHFFLDLIILP